MVIFVGIMEASQQNSQSSIDIRAEDFDLPPAAEYSPPTPAASRRRRKFFSSFRKKFRSGKYKDKNANIGTLSASQPNIYRSVYRSATVSTDNESLLSNEQLDFSKKSLDKSLSDQDMTCVRSRSQSERSGTKSEHGAIMSRSSEEQEEMDSGIAVLEAALNSQVGLRLIYIKSSVAMYIIWL